MSSHPEAVRIGDATIPTAVLSRYVTGECMVCGEFRPLKESRNCKRWICGECYRREETPPAERGYGDSP